MQELYPLNPKTKGLVLPNPRIYCTVKMVKFDRKCRHPNCYKGIKSRIDLRDLFRKTLRATMELQMKVQSL